MAVGRAPEGEDAAVTVMKTGARAGRDDADGRHQNARRGGVAAQVVEPPGGHGGEHFEVVAAGQHRLQQRRFSGDGLARRRRQGHIAGRDLGGDAGDAGELGEIAGKPV
jgi:hypothetical protein